MTQPTLDESIDLLKEVSGVDEFDPDTPLRSSGVDSLNLVEWVYEMQERHPELAINEAIIDGVDDTTTFRAVHDQLAVSPSATPAAP